MKNLLWRWISFGIGTTTNLQMVVCGGSSGNPGAVSHGESTAFRVALGTRLGDDTDSASTHEPRSYPSAIYF